MIYRIPVHAALKLFRTSRNWPQSYVAKKLNVTTSALSRYESGQRQVTLGLLRKYTELGLKYNPLTGEYNDEIE